MELLIGILVWAGPIGVLGAFTWFMVAKKGWTWPPVITSAILTLLIASAVPDLPEAMNNGVKGVITAFTNAQ